MAQKSWRRGLLGAEVRKIISCEPGTFLLTIVNYPVSAYLAARLAWGISSERGTFGRVDGGVGRTRAEREMSILLVLCEPVAAEHDFIAIRGQHANLPVPCHRCKPVDNTWAAPDWHVTLVRR